METPAIGIFCIGQDHRDADDFREKLFTKYPQFNQTQAIKNEDADSRATSINLHRYWQYISSSACFELESVRQKDAFIAKIDLIIFILTRPVKSFQDARAIARECAPPNKRSIFIGCTYDQPRGRLLRTMQQNIEKFKSRYNATTLFYGQANSCDLGCEMLKTVDCLICIINGCNENAPIRTDWDDITAIFDLPGDAKINQAIASGPERATQVVHLALSNLVLPKKGIKQSGFIANIRAASELKLSETRDIMARLRNESKLDAQCIFSCSYDESLQDAICLTVLSKFDEPEV